jgi:hypothetical protein
MNQGLRLFGLLTIAVSLPFMSLGFQSQTPKNNPLEILPKHSGTPPIAQLDNQTEISFQEKERRDSRTSLSQGLFSHSVGTDPGALMVNGNSQTVDLTFIDSVTLLKPGEVKDPPGLPILGNSIVLGKITSGDAYLNDGRTGVFSEYLINVTEVLKSDPTSVISAGDEISAWRMGGSLKFHSGHLRHVLIAGVGFPKVGTDYLFFLRTSDARIKDYAISTAYSLSDQVVYSLDANTAQSAFDGIGSKDFLRTVRNEILARHTSK